MVKVRRERKELLTYQTFPNFKQDCNRDLSVNMSRTGRAWEWKRGCGGSKLLFSRRQHYSDSSRFQASPLVFWAQSARYVAGIQ